LHSGISDRPGVHGLSLGSRLCVNDAGSTLSLSRGSPGSLPDNLCLGSPPSVNDAGSRSTPNVIDLHTRLMIGSPGSLPDNLCLGSPVNDARSRSTPNVIDLRTRQSRGGLGCPASLTDNDARNSWSWHIYEPDFVALLSFSSYTKIVCRDSWQFLFRQRSDDVLFLLLELILRESLIE